MVEKLRLIDLDTNGVKSAMSQLVYPFTRIEFSLERLNEVFEQAYNQELSHE